MESVGQRIRRLRKKNKMTQDSVAAQLNVERVTISRYESDAMTPRGARLVELAKLFDCSVDYLLGVEDPAIPAGPEEHEPRAEPADGPAESDPDLRMIARIRRDMSEEDRQRMMDILKLTFTKEFGDGK